MTVQAQQVKNNGIQKAPATMLSAWSAAGTDLFLNAKVHFTKRLATACMISAAAMLSACTAQKLLAPQPAPIVALPEQSPDPAMVMRGQFLAKLQAQGFSPEQVNAVLDGAVKRDDILTLISKPAESKAWKDYGPIFLNDVRINSGVVFWRDHEASLLRAEQQYGVPARIVCAIIGVETNYGRQMGKYRVIDALTTLAFYYPPRASYFSGELEQYFLLAREQKWDINALMGSYAGAVGYGQFMPTSQRKWALDFNGDGAIQLSLNADDAIGSVAHYFAQHGWQKDGNVMFPAHLSKTVLSKDKTLTQELSVPGVTSPVLINNNATGLTQSTATSSPASGDVAAPAGTVSAGGVSLTAPIGVPAVFTIDPKTNPQSLMAWKNAGVESDNAWPSDVTEATIAQLLNYEETQGVQYYFGLANFAVITQYNRSPLYARAVYELSERLQAAHDAHAVQ